MKRCRHDKVRTIAIQLERDGDTYVDIVCNTSTGRGGCGRLLFGELGNSDYRRAYVTRVGKKLFRVTVEEVQP